MAENLLVLKGFEKKAMGLYHRFGALGLISIATLFSVIASVAIAVPLITFLAADSTPEDLFNPYFYINVVIAVPCIVAPLCTFMFTRLLSRLNYAYEKVAELSTIDPLTGSTNRRGFMYAAKNDINSLLQSQKCLIGMVDVDKFKQVNDTHGHHVGDEALTHLAKSLSENINTQGLVGRLGGDEFAFVAFGNSSSLTKLQEKIGEHCNHLTLDGGIDISCSIGMVTLNDAESLEDALARADGVLYKLKNKPLLTDNASSSHILTASSKSEFTQPKAA